MNLKIFQKQRKKIIKLLFCQYKIFSYTWEVLQEVKKGKVKFRRRIVGRKKSLWTNQFLTNNIHYIWTFFLINVF